MPDLVSRCLPVAALKKRSCRKMLDAPVDGAQPSRVTTGHPDSSNQSRPSLMCCHLETVDGSGSGSTSVSQSRLTLFPDRISISFRLLHERIVLPAPCRELPRADSEVQQQPSDLTPFC